MLPPRPSTPPPRGRDSCGRRWLPLLLIMLVLPTAVRCEQSRTASTAVLVSTGDLWAAPERYDGRRVRTTGVVLGFNVDMADEHFVVEGSAQRRVELRGADAARLRAMQGRRVEVLGRFHFDEAEGFRIDVETVTIVG